MSIYSEQERRKFRKKWLISSITYQLILPLIFTIGFFIYLNIATDFQTSISIINNFLFFLIPSALIFLWLFYCAYKKNGTKLLTFFLIVTPLGWLREFTEAYSFDPIYFIFMITSIPFFIWWYKDCLYLRALNKDINYKKI